jgi:hypothetical protein
MASFELESDLPRALEDVHALMFRLDDFTYSEALRGLVAIAKSAKRSIPVVLEYVRAIGASDPSWSSAVKSGLG